MRKSVAAAALAGSLVVGGATGALLFGPSLAGAQTTTTTPGTQNGSSFKSNEDPAHEANETPEQEAAEDSGQFHGGRGAHAGHGSNEDPAHEGNETPEQEAAEDARAAAGGSNGTTPGSASSSATHSAARFAGFASGRH